MMRKLMKTEGDLSTLLLRLGLGVMIFPHGAQKLLGWWGGHGFSATIQASTERMGLPWVVAFLVVIGEFFGGLGLIMGLFERVAAAGVGIIMVGAMLTHLKNGFFLNWTLTPNAGHGFEFHLLAIAIAAAIVLRGSGALSLDRSLTKAKEPGA